MGIIYTESSVEFYWLNFLLIFQLSMLHCFLIFSKFQSFINYSSKIFLWFIISYMEWTLCWIISIIFQSYSNYIFILRWHTNLNFWSIYCWKIIWKILGNSPVSVFLQGNSKFVPNLWNCYIKPIWLLISVFSHPNVFGIKKIGSVALQALFLNKIFIFFSLSIFQFTWIPLFSSQYLWKAESSVCPWFTLPRKPPGP